MKIKAKDNVLQKQIPINEIKEKGILQLKNGNFIKIIKIFPINYELKSDLEKEAILNSYKIFLKSCNFNFQILIQSKKENLSKHFFILEQERNSRNTKEKNIYENYFKFIKRINSNNNSSSKNFYIIISQEKEILKNNPKIDYEKILIEKLQEKYFKIKETLTRCGNIVYEVEKEETIKILFSFFNKRKSDDF